MVSVILFRPAYDLNSRSTPTFPWAFMYLASVLVQKDIDVTIIDETCEPDALDRLDTALDTKKPVAVGITAMTGDQIRFGLACAARVRQRSKAAIVWGGIHATLLPEQTARHPLVDYVAAGEGEFAFTELVECLAQNGEPATIPGVFFKCGDKIWGSRANGFLAFGALPEIPYHLIDVERYIVPRPDLGIKRYFEICTSRGCPHHCGFCYVESVHGCQWRPLSAEATVTRIQDLVKRFNIDGILFREDNFFVDRKRVETIAQKLVDQNIAIKWAASCRINYFAHYTPEFIELLRKSGCRMLTFGVEAGSERVLQFIRKEITVEMVLKAAERLSKSGIRGSFHFMGGFPGETPSEFLETCRLINQLMQISPENTVRELAVFTAYPGTALVPACTVRGYREPESLEGWVGMDWTNPQRPWLNEQQSRLLSDADFLIARLRHPNPVLRAWVWLRWRQFLNSNEGIRLPERSLLNWLRPH